MSSLRVVKDEQPSFFGMLGAHPTMLALFDDVGRAAALEAPVVVSGPTGSGKELVARALHALSSVSRGPFCPVNVGALPETVVESELFGSARGGFTGATDRRGLIEAATEGTLFLDEGGDLPLFVQPKLLRAIELGEVRRVGASGTVVVRLRLIVATAVDPELLVREGRWRADFYHRVAGVLLRVPPLADRPSDIRLLAVACQRGAGLPPLEPEAIPLLEAYAWPGNVRELQHVLARAAFHARDGAIGAEAVRRALGDGNPGCAPADARTLAGAKWRHVRDTVEACGGDTVRAAALLRISRSQVYRILRSERAAGAPRFA